MPSKYSFRYKTFSKVNHAKIVSNSKVLRDIGAIVGAPPKRKSLIKSIWMMNSRTERRAE